MHAYIPLLLLCRPRGKGRICLYDVALQEGKDALANSNNKNTRCACRVWFITSRIQKKKRRNSFHVFCTTTHHYYVGLPHKPKMRHT